MDVGDTHGDRLLLAGEKRLGVERADLRGHLPDVGHVDAAGLGERPIFPLGEERQIVEQRPHRRVETVPLRQLQREAFAETAREDSGRLQPLAAR